MGLSDRYEGISPSSLQSASAECAAVTKLCGNVAKILVHSTAVSLESGLEESPVIGQARAQSGSKMSRSSEKISECYIRTEENRYYDAFISRLRGTD
jgi:hypothetical protein